MIKYQGIVNDLLFSSYNGQIWEKVEVKRLAKIHYDQKASDFAQGRESSWYSGVNVVGNCLPDNNAASKCGAVDQSVAVA